MTQTEYENKKAECWEEFKKLDRKSPYSLREVNAFAFDRGYALGREKETVTQEEIEKAAKDYAYDIGDSDWERMRLQDAFIDGINHIMQLPLCDRMTAEEKERMRKEYANTYPLDPDCGVANILIQGVLERIFGTDFFKEGE